MSSKSSAPGGRDGLPVACATAALVGWEFLNAKRTFSNLRRRCYRPKVPPGRRSAWCTTRPARKPGFRCSTTPGAPLYPELKAAELDHRIRRERIGGLMLREDWSRPRPLANREGRSHPHASQGQGGHSRLPGLYDELSFTSFRYGGFTGAADSGPHRPPLRSGRRKPQVEGAAAALRQADHETGRGGRRHQSARTRRRICQNEPPHDCQNGFSR